VRAAHSADRPFVRFFSSSTLQISIGILSAQGCVSSPSRKLALQRFGLLCGKPVKSFDPWACSLQKVTDTLDSCFFPLTTHSQRPHQHDHEQLTFNRRWNRRREHRRGEETSNHHKQHQQRNNSREAASSAVLLDDANDLNYSVHHSHSYPPLLRTT
jgi:hypothetical protein